jgi:regulator of nonsense transcripts 1
MQPYAIPSRGGGHGPIGGIPQIPQSGSRGFGAGRGISTGGPIGGHLSHHQASQQHAGLGTSFGFGGLDNLATQPSVGGLLTQQGSMTQVYLRALCSCVFHMLDKLCEMVLW